MQQALDQPTKALIDERLLKHLNVRVKVYVASCLCEITRITAPDAPYNDEKMKDVFQLIVSSFEGLSDASCQTYGKRVSILETVSKLRSSVIMLDLECEDLIVQMFEHLLNSIRDHHLNNIFPVMENIMVVVLEACEDISADMIKPLLARVKNDSEGTLPVARKLAEDVLKKCTNNLKPYLKKLVTLFGGSLYKYNQVFMSICEGTLCMFEPNDESALVQPKGIDVSLKPVQETATEGEGNLENALCTFSKRKRSVRNSKVNVPTSHVQLVMTSLCEGTQDVVQHNDESASVQPQADETNHAPLANNTAQAISNGKTISGNEGGSDDKQSNQEQEADDLVARKSGKRDTRQDPASKRKESKLSKESSKRVSVLKIKVTDKKGNMSIISLDNSLSKRKVGKKAENDKNDLEKKHTQSASEDDGMDVSLKAWLNTATKEKKLETALSTISKRKRSVRITRVNIPASFIQIEGCFVLVNVKWSFSFNLLLVLMQLYLQEKGAEVEVGSTSVAETHKSKVTDKKDNMSIYSLDKSSSKKKVGKKAGSVKNDLEKKQTQSASEDDGMDVSLKSWLDTATKGKGKLEIVLTTFSKRRRSVRNTRVNIHASFVQNEEKGAEVEVESTSVAETHKSKKPRIDPGPSSTQEKSKDSAKRAGGVSMSGKSKGPASKSAGQSNGEGKVDSKSKPLNSKEAGIQEEDLEMSEVHTEKQEPPKKVLSKRGKKKTTCKCMGCSH